jgi:hypothetical protein
MFIKQITSYGDAWRILNDDYPNEIAEIREAIESLFLSILDENRTRKNNDDFRHNPRAALDDSFSKRIEEKNWVMMTSRQSKIINVPISIRGVGHIKSGIAVRFHRHREIFNRWLYTITPIASKNNIITIPIAIMAADSNDPSFKISQLSGLAADRLTEELKALEPLSYGTPFLIIGVSSSSSCPPFVVEELTSNISVTTKDVIINRSLEFPPEYHQAGLGILNYFGTVLRDKYPNTKARVRIEQEGLCVRLIIESENGDKEIIEKALEEYESVVRGEISPEKFLDSKIKIIELRQELRIAEIRIAHQQDVIQFHREQVLSLTQLIGHSLSQPPPNITIDISPTISTHAEIINTIDIPLAGIFDSLSTISELSASNPELQLRILDLEKSLSLLESGATPTETHSSSGLKKLKSFLDDATKTGTAANSFFKTVESGIDIAQDLARKYNGLASWCGAPQIPKALLGADK